MDAFLNSNRVKNPLESTYCPHNHFRRFIAAISDYLYDKGWYTQSWYISVKAHSFQQAESYLWNHCYDREKAVRIVRDLKRKTTFV
jgi:hypothetical protein